MTRPTLTLLPATREELSAFGDAFASIEAYFTLAEADPEDPDFAAAVESAESMRGATRSSDIDCDYYPCTFAAPELDSEAFFTAVGVARATRTTVGGFDNPKLEVVVAGDGDGEHERPALVIISWLTGVTLDDIEEYISPLDFADAIALLERSGKLHGVQLCTDDGVSKIQLTVSRRPSGVYAGVITLSIET